MRKCIMLIISICVACTATSQIITANPGLSLCPSQTTVLTASPTGTSYQWQESATATGPFTNIPGATSVSYTTGTANYYQVLVTSGPPPTTTTYPAVHVTIKPLPVVNFNFTPLSGCGKTRIQFTNTSTPSGAGVSYNWNFGDASSSNQMNPSHLFFPNPGTGTQTYNVTLTVTLNGCSASMTQTITIGRGPDATLGGNPAVSIFNGQEYFVKCSSNPQETFTFYNQSTTTNTNYVIKWGDGSPNYSSTSWPVGIPGAITHPYLAGLYQLTFIVTAGTCVDSTIYNVFTGSNPTGSISSPGGTYGCTGETYSFPFANVSTNPPGTDYFIFVNDGTPDTIHYTQATLPASFTHTFNTTSCGVSPNNTFTITYSISNPCGETPGQIGGIRISTKALAAFTISPKDTVCQNSTVTFTSTGTTGSVVPLTGSGPCTPGKLVWDISPTTGWTTGGALGSTNGHSDSSIYWTAGTSPLAVVFNTPGTYTIKLYVGASKCGVDSITKTICVTQTPVSAFTLDQNIGCAPLVVNTNNTSPPPLCGQNKYQWTVTYASTAGCVPNTSGYVFLGGTSATSVNPLYQFNNPGVYTISLITIAPASACTSAVVSKTVTVKEKPNVTMATLAAVCENTAISPAATALCYVSTASYLWTFPGGSPASSNTLNPGSVTFPTGGSINITLAATNECGTTTVTQPITILPKPVLTLPSSNTYCAGSSVGPLAFTSSLAGTSFSWTNTNTLIGLASSGTSNPIPVFTATDAGTSPITGTISVTGSLSGCSSTNSFTITVNPTPPLPTAANVNYCQNTVAVPLTATPSAGNTLLWYTTPTGGVGNPTAPTPSTTTIGTTTYYVSQVNTTTNCEGLRKAIIVTVNAVPVISSSSSANPTACGATNGTITLNGLNASTLYTVQYNMNGGPVTVSLTSTSGGVIIITGLSAGVYTNITVSLAGCTSALVGPFTLADPSQPVTPIANASSPICTGNTISLSATSSTVGVTFNWTGPNGFNTTGANPSILNATLAAAGAYFVTASLSGCTSSPASAVVIVNQTPALPTVGSNSPVCTGNTLNLTANTTFAGAVNWSWTGPNSFTSNLQNPAISPVTSAAAGSYTVTATNPTGACSTAPVSTTVVINTTPVLTTIQHTDPTACSTSTGTITLTGLSAITTYQVHYTFNASPIVINITTNSTGDLVIPNLAQGNYTNIYVVLLGCTSNTLGPVSLTDPNPPAAPTAGGGGAICSGNTLNLTASTPATGATYNWTGPNGFTSASQNPTIPNITVAASGTYLVTITVSNCTSPAAAVNVLVNQSPVAPVANSNSPVCTDSTLNLTASTTFSGAVTWQWTGPNSFNSNQQNPSITNMTPAGAGTYNVTVTAVAGNCPSAITPVSVVVNQTPVVASVTSINPSSCSSATGSITLTGLVPNASYIVNYLFNGNPVTTTIVADGAGSVNINTLTSGTYSNISVTNTGCRSAIAGPVTLTDPNPPATPNASSNSPVCNGASINLSATTSTVGPVTYSWTGSSGFTSATQNPVILNATPVNAGWYYVSVTLNNCQSLNDSVNVVVNPLAAAPLVSSPVQYCINTASVALTATALPSYTLNWYTTATGGVPLPSAPIPPTTVAGLTTWYVSQTTPAGCEGSRSSIDVIIHPDSKALFIPTDTIECPPYNITTAIINLQQFTFNSTYNWYANDILIGSGTTFPGYTILNENDSVRITLQTISAFGCKQDSMSQWFHTFHLPHPSFIKDTAVGCGPMVVQFTNTTPNIGLFTYAWDFGNGLTSTAVQPAPVIFTTNPTFNDTVYIIKLSVLSICDTVTFIDSVRIKSKPKALFTPSRTTGCSPMRVLFTNNSQGNNNVYYWDLGDGTNFVTTIRDTFSHVYNTGVTDTFYVKLVVVNECGSDSIMYNLIVSPNNINLNLIVNGTQQAGCAPHVVAFVNNTFGATSFQWDFGDGNVQSTTQGIDTVYHTYLSAGTYTAILHAFNGCTDTIGTHVINVYPKPVTDFDADHYTICIGQAVQFTNNSTAATTYLWNFGDGNTSTLVSPSHIYTVAGTYTVRLITYRLNPGGTVCIDSLDKIVQVNLTLPGNVNISPISSPCAPVTVTFSNHDLPSSTVVWDFGDGTFGSGDNTTHTYTLPGTYLVSTTVTAPGGCQYLSTQTITVGGPTGTFIYNGGFACYPAPVRFDVSGSGISTFEWIFGDGNTQTTTTSTVFHNYTNPGTYTPSVILHSASCNLTLPGTVPIKVDKIDPGFKWNNQQLCGSTNTTFTDTSFAYFGIQSTTWDFGDASTGTGSTITHSYSSPGTYNVTMTVTGISGCIKTVTTPVTVVIHNIPITSISGDAIRCANENVTFTANISTTDPVNLTSWLLSNGATGNGISFTYLFNIPGTYILQLISATTFGCADTANHTITINPVPFITASVSVTICLGSSANLFATGTSAYQWTPTDGLSCNTCPNPTATPIITTPYIVSGTNSFGCSASDTVVVTVIQPFSMTATANDSICIGQSINLLATGATSYIWSPATGLSSTIISNPVASPTTSISYRVVGYDGYNCFTDTAFILIGVGQYPTVDLGPDKTLSTGTQVPLATTITNGPISQWLWTPSTDLNCNTCPLPIATIKKNITYIVDVTSAYGCRASDTISFKTFCEDTQVFIANAFTPDGDGVNDILFVQGKGIGSVKSFRIFNRWGEVVFERNNFPPNITSYGWDGKIKGIVGPSDVFVYTAEVICDNGTAYTYKGNTSIIK